MSTTGQEPSESPNPGGAGGRPASEQDSSSWRSLFFAAVVVVVLYAAFAAFAYTRAGDGTITDVVWSHTVWVVQGVEAIAFTAVGWLFGREVRRGEAEAAKKQADSATQDAQDAKARAHNSQASAEQARSDEKNSRERAFTAEQAGSRLAEAVRIAAVLVPAQPDQSNGGDESSGGRRETPTSGAPWALDPLRDLANQLFPPA